MARRLAWFLPAVLAVTVLGSPSGRAQDPPGAPDVGAMNARAALLVDRLLRLTACLTEARGQAADAQLMVEQAARQARDPAASAEVRRAAQGTLRALAARLERIERGAERCVAENGQGGFVLGERRGAGVRYVDAAPTAAEASVAQAAPSLEVLERDVRLASGVRIARGERIDGSGRVDASRVRRAVRDVAEAVRRCWDDYAARRTDPRGEAQLVFTVGRSGAARRVRVEASTISAARFRRCLTDAGRRLRLPEGSVRDGQATFAYTLRFGG